MESKIKLIAIAKDEAAYLPEWIFHHLHFGFDAIDIYVNNTTDNTFELSNILKGFSSVKLLNGDVFFNNEAKSPQLTVYNEAFLNAKNAGFSHVMFLDIDEFWTPVDMKSTIKNCLSSLDADVVSFGWLNKFENKKFAPVIEAKITGEHHPLVKTIMSVNINIEKLDIHNVTAKNAKYALSDGSTPIFTNTNQKLVSIDEVKPYFIIHRMYRSSEEYVSLLGRGRPKGGSVFKDNRNGFCQLEYKLKTITLNEVNTLSYHQSRENFLEMHIPFDYMHKAYCFIDERYNGVLELIKNASVNDLVVLRKILRNLELADVNAAYAFYLQNIFDFVAKDVTDNLRDAAILLEKRNLNKSLKLMQLASVFRPKGQLIINKIEEYKNKLIQEKR
ncbi:glycosyltransferase family 2 protein [Psychromonas sp. L1A2]|uniref:glycosyltransferase family 2 protein n=1 Tax=Psychromonas sp. L1A2 TaxID=2686356 RepID=UPI00135C3264|nr:glycosyltransferase family 2 protein [Psychromonas sp. L1A2]